MARVRSTARVTRDGEEAKTVETAPISEVMKRSGLKVPEDVLMKVPLKLSKLVLRKMNLKMIIVSCHLNPATWSLGGPPLLKMICLSW